MRKAFIKTEKQTDTYSRVKERKKMNLRENIIQVIQETEDTVKKKITASRRTKKILCSYSENSLS